MSAFAPTLQENPPSPGFLAPDPRNYANAPAVRDRALTVVQDAMSAARNARGSIAEAWQQNDNAFFNIRHRRNFKGRANVVDPEPFRAIETTYARIVRALLGQKPWIRGFPGPGEVMADLEQAALNEALLQQQLEVGSDGKRLLKSNAKSWLIRGTSVQKINWDIETRRRRVRNPNTGKLANLTDANVYQGPRWRNVDLDCFFVGDPLSGENPDEMDYVIEEKVVDIAKVQAGQRLGFLHNTAGIKASEFTGQHNESEDQKVDRAVLLGLQYDPAPPLKPVVGKCRMLMFEGKFDLYDNGEEIECWIWVVNGMHVVRVQENPYWHGRRSYVSAPCIRVPGCFYGLSPIQPILDLWAELNDLHNMGLDSAVLSLNPAIIVGATAGLDLKKWVLRPGAILPAQNPDAIREFEFTPMTQVAHQAMAPLRQMMRETTSATDLLQAQSQGGIDKATIYQGAIQEANVRIAMMGDELADMLESGGTKHWGLNQQYMKKETLVRILGGKGFKWVPVRPQDVKYPMDWKAVGVQNIGSELTRTMGLERFVATFTPLALQGAVKLDFHQIAKDYYVGLGMADPDRIIAPTGPQPMDPRQENLMLRQRQPVDVHPQEDHATHYREHLAELQRMQAEPVVDPIVVQMLQQHIGETEAMFKRVQAAQQAMAQYQAQMAMNQLAAAGPRPNGQGSNGGASQGVPALGNQAQFGPQMGAAKELGERMGGRLG